MDPEDIPGISIPPVPESLDLDVEMKRLPFYDVTSELMKPYRLQSGNGRGQEESFVFYLTTQQASEIGESKEYVAASMGKTKLQFTTQVHLRFYCLRPNTSHSQERDDKFPPNLSVKVNDQVVLISGQIPSKSPRVKPKRPSGPLDITQFLKISPFVTNTICVNWTDNSRGYAISLCMAKKLSSGDLLTRIKQKGVRLADYTRGLIKELIAKDDGDCMIAMTSLKVSIECPLGKCRMNLPCRATTCKHLQCFDANLFLQMNERKPTWVCPVCDNATLFEDLYIDGYFQEVISQMEGSGSMDVELLPDGSWRMISSKTPSKARPKGPQRSKKMAKR